MQMTYLTKSQSRLLLRLPLALLLRPLLRLLLSDAFFNGLFDRPRDDLLSERDLERDSDRRPRERLRDRRRSRDDLTKKKPQLKLFPIHIVEYTVTPPPPFDTSTQNASFKVDKHRFHYLLRSPRRPPPPPPPLRRVCGLVGRP